jgi:hypothetical protein
MILAENVPQKDGTQRYGKIRRYKPKRQAPRRLIAFKMKIESEIRYYIAASPLNEIPSL